MIPARVITQSRRAKQLLGLVAVVTVTASLGACSSGDKSSTSASSTSASSTTPAAATDATTNAPSKSYGTRTTGTVSVVWTNSLMPYVGANSDGTLTGAEGQLFVKAAAALNLKVKSSNVEFPALLAGIQSDRYDVAVGGVAWTPARAKTGVMTDPIFYSPIMNLSKPGTNFTNIDQLKGHTVGAPSGTTADNALVTIKGVKVHTYATVQTELADLQAGRIDTAVLDPLVVAYSKKTIPALKNYNLNVIAPPTAAQVKANPILSQIAPYMVVWYCAKQATQLCSALNSVIDGWYKSGVSLQSLSAWGANPSFFTAPPATVAARRGVDRPGNWQAPTRS